MSDSKQESIVRTMSQLFSGLRFRLVLLVVLASLPPVVLTLHIARQDRQRQTAALRQRSQDMVKLAARKEDEMIAGTRQLLRAVAESSQVQSAQWGNCTKLLRTLFADYPRYANLGVIKTNGDVSASAPALTEPVNLADRSFFQRVLATRDLSIGDYQVGRISGKPSFSLAYPVFDPSGQVQAVVFAALDLDWVNRSDYALQMQLPEGATWTKIDGKGTILVRYPAPEKGLVGEPLPEMSLLKTFLTRKNGVMEAVDPKGISVFYDFTSTRSALVAGDVISILSIPRKVLFAEPDRVMIRNLTSVGIVAGLVLVIGWIGSRYLILRPIQALVNFTAQLGAGDHSARTGLPRARDELRQLMRAFDQMAEALQQREAERQSADHALKASEMRYRRLFETAQDGILILNAGTGQIDDVNPFLTDLLGYTREQLLGNKLWEIGPFKDTKASKAEFRELQREAYVRYDDLPLETSAGRSINVEFVSNVYEVNGGKVIQCNIRDITKRKQAEAHLQLQSTALEAAANAIVITDRSGAISWANSAFTRLTGYSATEVLGANMRLLKSGQHDQAFYQNLWQTILDGQTWHAEIINRRKNGSLYTEDNTITAVRDARGEITHFISVKQDITERKRAQGKLKESRQRLQTAFPPAGGSAGDRTPAPRARTPRRNRPGPHRRRNEPASAVAVAGHRRPGAALAREPSRGGARAGASARPLAELAPVHARRFGPGAGVALVHRAAGRAGRPAGRSPGGPLGAAPGSHDRNRVFSRGPGSAYQRGETCQSAHRDRGTDQKRRATPLIRAR